MSSRTGKVLFALYAIMVCASLAQASPLPGIPAGTPINVRINEKLSSETARPGDLFTGVLTQPVAVNGSIVYPRGTAVKGEVVQAKKSGRLSDPGVLELTLISIGSGPRTTSVVSQPFVIKGASHTKSNVTKIGGTTAVGAIIGGVADGGKGAAIGAGVGAGTGTAVAAATGKKPATVEPEAVLVFLSNGPGNPPAVQQHPAVNRYADERNDHQSDVHRRHSRHDDDDDDDDDRDDDRGRSGRHHDDYDNDHRRDSDRYDGYRFGDRDRDILLSCLSNYQFESLPPGIQKKLARGGTLPPGQAKKLHELPGDCTVRLPHPPRDVVRIIFGDRVILLDRNNRILDIFLFER